MSKINREEVYKKCDGHCAYCGCEITLKQMQVDHIEPHWHTVSEQEAVRCGIKKGSHEIDNLNPSCARCNRWKSTWKLEQFREEIRKQIERLERDSSAFRMARDFNLLKVTQAKVTFYFETQVRSEIK